MSGVSTNQKNCSFQCPMAAFKTFVAYIILPLLTILCYLIIPLLISNQKNHSTYPPLQPKHGKRIAIFFGTRPEIIKLSPLIRVLRDSSLPYSSKFEVILINSGQQRELVDEHLKLFNLEGDLNLNLMTFNQSLSQLFANVMTETASILSHMNPDLILVHGDTNTALAVAMTAFHNKIPVGHVEAGLRSFDYYQPYPEEMNRKIIDSLSSLHFAVTEYSRNALIKEGICEESILITGNTVIDAIRHFLKRSPSHRPLRGPLIKILVTAHRRENIGAPLISICNAILEILKIRSDVEFLIPVHPNPNVYHTIHHHLGYHPRVNLTIPLRYDEFVQVLSEADIVMTDSGGIQEECTELDKPVLLLRDTTERSEGIRDGVIRMVGTKTKSIVEALIETINNPPQFSHRETYGSGNSSQMIADVLLEKLVTSPTHLTLCTTLKT